jgi:hypothetical protein
MKDFKKLLTFGLQYYKMIMGHKSEVNKLADLKKMGRPTDNPKGTSIHVRLDEDCTNTLVKYCSQEKISRAEAIRRGIIGLKEKLQKK